MPLLTVLLKGGLGFWVGNYLKQTSMGIFVRSLGNLTESILPFYVASLVSFSFGCFFLHSCFLKISPWASDSILSKKNLNQLHAAYFFRSMKTLMSFVQQQAIPMQLRLFLQKIFVWQPNTQTLVNLWMIQTKLLRSHSEVSVEVSRSTFPPLSNKGIHITNPHSFSIT